ncbi:ZN414 protein, partial [Hippolais icterina]|nr:ZN414 protein [Hippolais icterina]
RAEAAAGAAAAAWAPVPPVPSPGWNPLCPFGARGHSLAPCPGFGVLPLGRDPLSVWGWKRGGSSPQSPAAPPGSGRSRGDPGGDPGAIPVLPCPPVLAGHSSNSRIVWEHTRGRYSCTQCPFSTASREEMTLHIEDHRKNAPPARLEAEMDFGVGLAPFHTKLPPEMESSLYSQL